MTNFDRFTNESAFASFAESAVAAERIYAIDPGLCVLSCRRSLEAAVKWMYSVDGDLDKNNCLTESCSLFYRRKPVMEVLN